MVGIFVCPSTTSAEDTPGRTGGQWCKSLAPGFAWLPFGGGEESRTPVRKPIHTAFSGCSRLFTFPYPTAKRQADGLGSSQYSRQAGALLPAVHHEVTPEPGPWSSPVRRQPLIRLRKQQYDCRLLLRLPVL